MNFITIAIDIAAITFVGYCIGELYLYATSYSLLKKVALSYALGFGLIGMQMFVYSELGVSWNVTNLVIPWTIVFAYFFIRKKPKINGLKISNLFRHQNFAKSEKFLAILVFLLLFFVGVESIMRPIQAWDGWDNWVFRSNVFYMNGEIDKYYFSYTTDSYPLLIPLTVTAGYLSIGEIDDRTILLFYYMFYASLGILFYSVAKEHAGRKIALLFTFLLLSTQNFVRHGGRFEVGQADLAVGFYIFAGAIVLFDYLKSKSARSLLLLSFILGISIGIKNDALPFTFLALGIALYSILKEKKFLRIIYLIPFPLLVLPWEIFKRVNHLHANFLIRDGVSLHLERIPNVAITMSKEFINIQNWNLLWITFILCLYIFRKELKHQRLIISIIAFQWLAYMAIFLIIPSDPTSQINAVANKLYLHIGPLAVLTIVLIYRNILGGKIKTLRKSV